MADDSSEDKTEEGSEKKVRDALDSGNVPFSREASVLLSLGTMLILASFVVANNVRALAASLVELFANPVKDPFATTADALVILGVVARACATFLWPIMIMMMVGGLIAGFAQGLPQIALKRIAPKWSKLSPAAGLKRLLGRDGQIEFLKSLVKFVIVSVVIAVVMRSQGGMLLATMSQEPNQLGSAMLGLVARLLAGSLVAFAALASADLVWARMRWRRDLRMTRQEVKEEHKQAEGDPLLKAKRRSLALDRSRRRMMAAVPRATLVIANPTHFAIALRYVREEGSAPVVVAKGQDLIALKIRELAEQHDIPVFENKALARSMYDHVEVNQLIPSEFFKAVAELIHFIQARNTPVARAGVKA